MSSFALTMVSESLAEACRELREGFPYGAGDRLEMAWGFILDIRDTDARSRAYRLHDVLLRLTCARILAA